MPQHKKKITNNIPLSKPNIYTSQPLARLPKSPTPYFACPSHIALKVYTEYIHWLCKVHTVFPRKFQNMHAEPYQCHPNLCAQKFLDWIFPAFFRALCVSQQMRFLRIKGFPGAAGNMEEGLQLKGGIHQHCGLPHVQGH